jgi:hypothetical protein
MFESHEETEAALSSLEEASVRFGEPRQASTLLVFHPLTPSALPCYLCCLGKQPHGQHPEVQGGAQQGLPTSYSLPLQADSHGRHSRR